MFQNLKNDTPYDEFDSVSSSSNSTPTSPEIGLHINLNDRQSTTPEHPEDQSSFPPNDEVGKSTTRNT